jgi:hypothetical protein
MALETLWPMVMVLRTSLLALLLLLHAVMVKMLIDISRGTRQMTEALLDLTRTAQYAPSSHHTLACLLHASSLRSVWRRASVIWCSPYGPVERDVTRLSALHDNASSASTTLLAQATSDGRRDNNVLVALLVEQEERRYARADAQTQAEAQAEAEAEEAEEEDAFDVSMRAQVRQVVEAGLSRALGDDDSIVTPIVEACPGAESVDDVATMLAAKKAASALPSTPTAEQPRRRTRSSSGGH